MKIHHPYIVNIICTIEDKVEGEISLLTRSHWIVFLCYSDLQIQMIMSHLVHSLLLPSKTSSVSKLTLVNIFHGASFLDYLYTTEMR